MRDGSRAVALLNRGASEQPIAVTWEQIGYPTHLSAAIRDLWGHKELGKFTGRFSANVGSHAVVMLIIRP